MKKRSHPRLNAFEQLPVPARAIVEQALAAVFARQVSQQEGHKIIVEQLRELGVPVAAIPSKSAFNRLVIRGTPQQGSPRPLTISDETRTLIAQALRALADDLDSDNEKHLSEMGVDAIRRQVYGMPPCPSEWFERREHERLDYLNRVAQARRESSGSAPPAATSGRIPSSERGC